MSTPAKKENVERVPVRLAQAGALRYEIEIGENLLDTVGHRARGVLTADARRAVIVSNAKVYSLYGAQVCDSLRRSHFGTTVQLIGDGERYKSFRTLERTLGALQNAGIERSDVVIALGGGVVGDLAGLAAALYLRGIALLQIPTTLLSQIDSSVGGKVAVNTIHGKNSIGAFHHPRAVVVDTLTLDTLPARELTAGWCEAVKQGAVASRKLFDATTGFLRDECAGNMNAANRAYRLRELISAQCRFKSRVVAGDERESPLRTDNRSRRILNFGHTIAHALEAITDYKRFRHGEAVGYGMLVAAEISVRAGLCDAVELESLRAALALTGTLPRANDLDENSILRRAAFDKKSVAGEIKWVLLERIGRAKLVGNNKIPARILRASLRAGLKHNS